MPLINCKVHLELNWTKNCVISSIAGDTALEITNTKLYVPIVTFSSLTKKLNKEFQRPVY